MRGRLPAWQQPLYDASTTISHLMTVTTNNMDGDLIEDLCSIYDNILRLERILYDEKTEEINYIDGGKA